MDEKELRVENAERIDLNIIIYLIARKDYIITNIQMFPFLSKRSSLGTVSHSFNFFLVFSEEKNNYNGKIMPKK